MNEINDNKTEMIMSIGGSSAFKEERSFVMMLGMTW